MLKLCLQKSVTTLFTFHERVFTQEMIELLKSMDITIGYPEQFSFGEAEKTNNAYYILTHLDEFGMSKALHLTGILKAAINALKSWIELATCDSPSKAVLNIRVALDLMHLLRDFLIVCQENPVATVEICSAESTLDGYVEDYVVFDPIYNCLVKRKRLKTK